jgi:heme/copper-type cytochrome/quinol oxidase subunit 1
LAVSPARPEGSVREGWLSSTDHKVIRYLYLSTAFGFFLVGVTVLLLRI